MLKKTEKKGAMNIWLNSHQAAEYLAYPNVRALYRAKDRGLVPFYKHGKRILFKQDELDDIIKQGQTPVQLNEAAF